MENPVNRLTFIDVARTYAIVLALLSHSLITTGVFQELGDDSVYITLFTRMATPMFVFMFGFMVEFVYVTRADSYGVQHISRRIYVRSFQCYVAYTLTSLCAFLGGFVSFEKFVASLLFLSDTRFGNILRVYSVMLLITPFVIKLRLKLGTWLLYFAVLTLLTVHSFIKDFQSIDFGIFNHLLNALFGIGTHRSGPSVMGAFIFYLSGMIVATGVRGGNLNLKQFYKSIVYVFVVLLVFGMIAIQEDIHEMWRLFADFTYRGLNAPAYYVIGTCCSVLSIAIFCAFIGNRNLIKPLRFILPIGTSSLISFTVGNMLLNLFGGYAKYVTPMIFIAIFFSAVILITRHIKRIPFYNKVFTLMNLEFNKVFGRTGR